MEPNIYLRGQIWRVKPNVARRLCVPKKDRPWVIVQNDDLSSYPARIACWTTSVLDDKGKFKVAQKLGLDTHVMVIADEENKLRNDSFIVCANLYTIRSYEFLMLIGRVSKDDMVRVDKALALAIALNKPK
jgi:mRNA-degrading endonuclease toxin of MazEF toxin-antitoxin module